MLTLFTVCCTTIRRTLPNRSDPIIRSDPQVGHFTVLWYQHHNTNQMSGAHGRHIRHVSAERLSNVGVWSLQFYSLSCSKGEWIWKLCFEVESNGAYNTSLLFFLWKPSVIIFIKRWAIRRMLWERWSVICLNCWQRSTLRANCLTMSWKVSHPRTPRQEWVGIFASAFCCSSYTNLIFQWTMVELFQTSDKWNEFT